MCEENGNGTTEQNGNGNGRRLTGRQRAFLNAWFANGYNGTEAARTAGYGNGSATDNYLAMQASRTISSDKIRVEIERRFAAHGGTPAEVANVLFRQVRSSPADYVGANGDLDLERVQGEGRGVVRKITMRQNVDGSSVWSIECESPQGAAEKLARVLGMNQDRAQVEHDVKQAGVLERMLADLQGIPYEMADDQA